MIAKLERDIDPAKELLFARPGFLIRRLHQIHVAMFMEEFKSTNITPVQYGLMTAMAALPGLDQTSLGQEVGLDRTTTAVRRGPGINDAAPLEEAAARAGSS